MTNREKFTTAELAALDQNLAGYDRVVDEFVKQAAEQVALEGRPAGTTVMADHLAKTLNEDQLSSVAAIALIRLAAQQCPCLPGAPPHEHLRGGYRLDNEAKP